MELKPQLVSERPKQNKSTEIRDKHRNSIADVFWAMAETSSWHGVTKIASSRQKATKALWSIFLLFALAVLVLQLSLLFKFFYSHPTQTTISVGFGYHRFPAVSFCNLNPVRKSLLPISPNLERILYPTPPSHSKSHPTQDESSSQSPQHEYKLEGTGEELNSNYDTYDEYNDNIKNDEPAQEANDYFIDPLDKWEEVAINFKTNFKNESVETRSKMGHQREDFIHRATFALRLQNITSFKSFTTSTFGNCFTLDSDRYRVMSSGPDYGLKLTLNLEIDEYIKNFAAGYGVRMVIHEKGTLPMPAEKGIILNPGFETSIGIRVVDVTRLGYPYGSCNDGIAFRETYNSTYSIAACMVFCRTEQVVEECGCLPVDAPDAHQWNLTVCNYKNTTENICTEKVNNDFYTGKNTCDCVSPCRDLVYEKTVSGRRWPSNEFLKILMKDICKKNDTSLEQACLTLFGPNNASFDYDRYRNNFVRALIYFEDLNFQRIKETNYYTHIHFLSDIGGAMGLFLGVSVLSVLEFFQFILEIILFFVNGKQNWVRPERNRKKKTFKIFEGANTNTN